MSVRIAWSTSAQVSTGLQIQGAQAAGVGAYEHIVANIPPKPENAASSSVVLDIQPSNAADAVGFFGLTSSRYDSALTFSVTGGTADVPLDAPVFLMGGSVNKLLGATPKKITVKNTGPTAADIAILVGRKAGA